MADRRRLAEGLDTDELLDRKAAEAFVFNKPLPAVPSPAPVPVVPGVRLPLTTRLRADLGLALKRASLEREMAGTFPYQVQEILDAVLEPWLREHGYLE
ncbi:unnamed protein product [Gemmata massiliana]|uniref:Uncharacterized protein n=1 Tax=Gemmata massiliana TaxID=1210884 RepID=A0A6P2CV72_9BACT|nr:hypothetical protein [Gemmata massiliana]VTR91604.1 unnamed protein product [Gemmata massiliana]